MHFRILYCMLACLFAYVHDSRMFVKYCLSSPSRNKALAVGGGGGEMQQSISCQNKHAEVGACAVVCRPLPVFALAVKGHPLNGGSGNRRWMPPDAAESVPIESAVQWRLEWCIFYCTWPQITTSPLHLSIIR